MKTKVLSLCRDMKAHNIGQHMTNGGLILASMGILTAMIGNRVRINALDERVILGGDKLEKKFKEMYQSVIKKGEPLLGLFLFFCFLRRFPLFRRNNHIS